MDRRFVLAAACATSCFSFAFTANAQQTGAQQLRDIERLLRESPAPLQTEQTPEAEPIPDAAAAQPVPLVGAALTGPDGAPLPADTNLPVDRLSRALSGLVSPDTTAADIIRAHDDIRRTLREAGYLFTSVGDAQLAPAEGGAMLTIPLAGAVIARAEVVSPRPLEEGDPAVFELISSYLEPLRGKSNPTLADLERISLLASDLPGVRRATFVPSAGEAPGELMLFLNVELARWDAVLFADNRQAPSLGPIMAGGVFSFNSWNAMGATTELSAFNSANLDVGAVDLNERHTLQLTQKLYVNSMGGMLEARALWSATEPGDELEDLGLESKEIQFTGLYEHPLLRSRAWSAWAAAGFQWDASRTDASGGAVISDDVTSVFFGRLRGEQRDESGYTLGSAEVRFGANILNATEPEAARPSRAGADGQFVSARFDLERQQTLEFGYSLLGRVSAQLSDGALLASEQMTAGGGLFGKAYDPSEISGDFGYAVYGEFRYDMETTVQGELIGLQFYAFGDYAEISRYKEPTAPRATVKSVGGGVRIFYENSAMTLEVAKPVDPDVARTNDRDPRYFISLSQRF